MKAIDERSRCAKVRISRYLIGTVIVACCLALAWHYTADILASRALREGQLALEQQDYATARRYAERALARDPASSDAWLLAGLAAANEGRYQDALEACSRIPDDGSSTAVEARCIAGDIHLMTLADLPAARHEYRRAVEQDKTRVAAHHRLAYLEGLGGGGWLAMPHRIAIIRSGEFGAMQLLELGHTSDSSEQSRILQRYQTATPDSAIVLTAVARQARQREQAGEAIELLRRVVERDPTFLGAQVELGRALYAAERRREFLQWHRALPAEAEIHPEIWVLRGHLARDVQQNESAARCFWEAVRRDANHRLANFQLGQLLVGLGRSEEAAGFLERARGLEAYERALEGTTGLAGAEMLKTARLAESLSLFWEATGWCQLVMRLDVPAQKDRALEILDRVAPRLQLMGDSRSPPQANPARHVDLSHYRLPEWADPPAAGEKSVPTGDVVGRVSFVDSAAEAGIDFTYFNGGDPLRNGMQEMYEFTGGGAAVIDFNADGWPDLYFTQGTHWPVEADGVGPRDRLFQNLGNGRFVEVSGAAGVAEAGFSQGVTVGDFDNDGFPDLYVGNIGANRFYRNNGDGTFTDITGQAGVAGNRWTTSCLIADLNGDGWPDLYSVNYLAGDDLFTRMCGTEKGRTLCLPQYFPGAQDEVYLSLGDGRFRNVTEQAGVTAADGRGMGIVAADFSGRGQLDLFVGNDLAANFFFVNETASPGGELKFAERGMLSGLATNRDGRFEACMGIAAGDSDGDGMLDLFVTNFDLETNTLYRQRSDAIFEDLTHGSGLAADSVQMLGFGTQFLDGDLDGDLDLIATNGHVDDARSMGRMYQMPPQYFENRGDGSYLLKSPGELGAYFQAQYLGRGLARLDWNRDGLPDAVISHLDAPAALLTNRTEQAGHYLAVRLIAVGSARDAIGTRITATAMGRDRVQQLTAGDGYHASNQRLVTFGLGRAERVERLHIRWPSGAEQELTDVPVDAELTIVEGRPPVSRNGR